MNIKQFISLLIIGCCTPFSIVYAAAPVLTTSENIDFGDLMPSAGRCKMDHLTGNVSNTVGVNCMNTNTNRGLYRIAADANTLIRVTVFTHINSGDGIEFRPSGTISSSEGSFVIIPGLFKDIDSGVSGLIDISVGGELIIHAPQASGSEISIDYSIEYILTP